MLCALCDQSCSVLYRGPGVLYSSNQHHQRHRLAAQGYAWLCRNYWLSLKNRQRLYPAEQYPACRPGMRTRPLWGPM